MIETLESFDQQLLLFINGCNSSFFDTLFFYLTKTWASIPIYMLAAYLLHKQFGWKKAVLSIIVIACSIGLSDIISTECFKKTICRYRPTHNLEIEDFVHIVNGYRGGMYGFVSSHAANMFAFATCTALFLRQKKWTIFFLLWSVLICYTRMYLGVHYPADIACGALLGTIIAFICYTMWIKISKKIYNKTNCNQ